MLIIIDHLKSFQVKTLMNQFIKINQKILQKIDINRLQIPWTLVSLD